MKSLLFAAVVAMTATTVLASADLSLAIATPSNPIRAGYSSFLQVNLLNHSFVESAQNVVITITANVPVTCSCSSIGTIQPGTANSRGVSFMAPPADGTITITATVSSDTADPDLSNNTASVTLTVSTDPDPYINMFANVTAADVGVPFGVILNTGNFSHSDAHDVEVTVSFRTDVAVQSLPNGCSNPSAGRIVCDVATIAAQGTATFTPALVVPSYGSGSIVFTATATQREHDFDPTNSTAVFTLKIYDPFRVTTTANDGTGSLRQAILDANTACVDPILCKIVFAIGESSPTPWKTIRIASPLPAITASNLIFDGATQTRFSGDTNTAGPEIEISGGGTVDGDGLTIATCNAEVANMTIGGFRGNGLSVAKAQPSACTGYYKTQVHNLFIGTDPTGSSARPNGRGIGVSQDLDSDVVITSCVISGNTHSGIFGLGGHLLVSLNRIGVKADRDEPLPNGASGILVGDGCYGSDIGEQGFITAGGAPGTGANVIAFNGETGVAVSSSVANVAIRNNRIWGNTLLGIDIGLDGPGTGAKGAILAPTLTLAHYDPVSNKTIIEGDLVQPVTTFPPTVVNFYANDTGDPSGYGEGQQPIGSVQVTTPPHFHFEAPGNLTGKFISAATTRLDYEGFAKPAGYEQGLLSQTSEFSLWIEVR